MSNDESEDQVVSNLNEQSNSTPTRPVASFAGTGGLNVAVWKNKGENDRDNYSIRVEKSYKDDDGNYKSTSYLRDSDLLRVGKLLEQADDWIEQDRAKQRVTNAQNRAR